MRCGIYCRISTNDGRQCLDNQLVPLREWAKRLGATSVIEYTDELSGAKNDRANLNKLLHDAEHKKFDVLLIWDLSRLSREGIAPLFKYLERFKNNDVRVLSHQESWVDTKSPVSDLLLAILAWINQQEREKIRSRIMAGLENARRLNRKFGRPRLNVDIGHIKSLQAQGHSKRQIAKMVSVSRQTIARLLAVQNHPDNVE
jgi:DNA invertase Pin-like site-specific DNA recombinase